MTPESKKTKKSLKSGIENLPDYSEHNREKINNLLKEVKDKGKLSGVSDAIHNARTCMRIIDVLQSALQKRLRYTDRQNF